MGQTVIAKKPASGTKRKTEPKNVYLVPFPKVVFLYPSFLAALAAGAFLVLYHQFGGRDFRPRSR
jgi:hypothetical protein